MGSRVVADLSGTIFITPCAGVWLVARIPLAVVVDARWFWKMIKVLIITETRSHTAVPYLGVVSKKRLVNVHNNTWSTQHEWCIMIQELPAANAPEILVCLDCCILPNFGFVSSIGNWILTSPPVHQHHPLLQCQMGLCKEGPIPKPIPAGSVYFLGRERVLWS